MSLQLAEEIIKGRRLKRGEDLSFLLSEDLDELCAGADKIRKELCGNHVDLCSIINGRSGRCGEDCKFCAQSACHHTKVEEYPFLEPEEILEDCKRHEAKKVHRYSIVTAGRALTGAEMEKALRAYRAMKKECKVELCASHGLLSQEDFNRLKEAGVGRYHANIETSRRNFPNICTTHTYEQRVNNIHMLQDLGFEICSGGIIGMGESKEDVVDMLFDLKEINPEALPINFLIPIKGTPLQDRDTSNLTPEYGLKVLCLARLLVPTSDIRCAAGREIYFKGREKELLTVVNSIFASGYLTADGQGIEDTIKTITDAGFTCEVESD